MASSPDQERSTQGRATPFLAWVDPGWIFVLVGLVVLSAGILVPAWRESHGLTRQLNDAREAESRTVHRLDRTITMLDQLTGGEDDVRHRVSMSERNQLQPGDELVLRDLAAPSEVLQWLDASIYQADQLSASPVGSTFTISGLEAVATGPGRLWFLAAGAMCLCLGLVLGPSSGSRGQMVTG